MKKIFLSSVFCLIIITPLFVLAENKVEINTASLSELEKITGIGPVIGQRIIDNRPFYSIDDLLKVKGIGEKTLQKIKNQGLAYVHGQSSPTTIPETETPGVVENQKVAVPEKIYYRGIIINEILPSPAGADETNEFIELRNLNNFDVNLEDWRIEDMEGTTKTYVLPKETKILANGYLVFKRPETKILLNNDKDGVNLIWPNQEIIDSISYEKAPQNQSYNKDNNNLKWSTTITPGALNIITTLAFDKTTKMLSKAKKSDNNITTASLQDSVETKEDIVETDSLKDKKPYNSPWTMLIVSIIVILLSGGIILFLKFKSIKNQ